MIWERAFRNSVPPRRFWRTSCYHCHDSLWPWHHATPYWHPKHNYIVPVIVWLCDRCEMERNL